MTHLIFNSPEGHSVERESSKDELSETVPVSWLSQRDRRIEDAILQRPMPDCRLESAASKHRAGDGYMPELRLQSEAEGRPSQGQQGEKAQWKS